ncbi:2-polyprenyl-6-methoxyphenol hydroxylase-like FAD-dependent oxidoreductase [Kibdelosporangium banguiense]|uniref:2-polyprenyl-6-methoxyphenol hydroxylase-like FAD-dependent oxidoreductase n=1 Tax=Kibdelosporangium banguiense TaxID=1365924 RepID=A0ABS4T8U2_9PSEU|nr:FAD-dependent monooxygenase [Kibdelosporangium banguiense]MBP2320261.1 2-polyprenyl-6-methoxyphenol hydroxylase-like FAD-dependent oxidoreductase [Kibdelosporangium banguiense]
MTKALVVGGGIAGAVTAMALRQAGIESVVYEAYPTGADDIGAFLTIMKNGMNALRAVQAHQPVIDASFPATDVEYIDGTGTLLGLNPMRGDAHTIRRAVLYRVLHDEAARRGIPLEHGKRLVSATEADDEVVATFADGTTATGDLLVGADGIHSCVRALIDPAAPSPRFTGLTIAYGYTRATSFEPSADAYRMIAGKNAFFGYTTSPSGETWWFSRAPSLDLDTATSQNFIDLLSEDDTPAAEIVRTTGDLFINNAYDVPETPHWHSSRMVLVGDAAHAASPAAGQGASMALEDSVILAKCLRDIPGLEAAFARYTNIRRARVEKLVADSAAQSNRQGQSVRPDPTERHWLYDHHIDWQEPIS